MKMQCKLLLICAGFGLVSAVAQAEIIELNISGNLEDGGTFSGTFSYDSDVIDWNSNPVQGYFGLIDYNIVVIPLSAPGFTFTPCNPFVSDILRTAFSPATIVVRFSSCSGPMVPEIRLNLIFLDAKQTPVPWHPNVAPFPADFGEFKESVDYGGGAVDRSDYTVDDFETGDFHRVGVTSAEISSTDSADLSITKTDSPDPVLAGTTLTYTVTVDNAGPDTAENVVVTDALPSGVSFDATSGCVEDPNGVPTCTLGDIASNGSDAYTITVTVDVSTIGTITNSASVSSDTDDPDTGNNSATEDTFVNAPTDGDGDGVFDFADACPNTDWPDTYPTTGRLGRGRYTLAAPPLFDKNEGRVSVPDYTTADTNGCSCDQLVDGGYQVGSLRSNKRRGCTKATMENAPVGPPG